MKLIYLIEELKHYLKGINPQWIETNVEDIQVDPNGDLRLNCEENHIIQEKEEIIKSLEKELEDSQLECIKMGAERDKMEEEMGKVKDLLHSYKISPTDTIKDLSERNEWMEEELTRYKKLASSYLGKFKEFENQITTLRARKNKAVVSRCFNTGKLVAEYEGEKFYLDKVGE
jgi:hypothetical protein